MVFETVVPGETLPAWTEGVRDRTREGGYVKMEAVIGVIPLPTKECQEPSERSQMLSSRAFGWSRAHLTPQFQTSGLQN